MQTEIEKLKYSMTQNEQKCESQGECQHKQLLQTINSSKPFSSNSDENKLYELQKELDEVNELKTSQGIKFSQIVSQKDMKIRQ